MCIFNIQQQIFPKNSQTDMSPDTQNSVFDRSINSEFKAFRERFHWYVFFSHKIMNSDLNKRHADVIKII
ncbi:hypothetical protein V1478_013798 [Vespula squamosa]|uniref:Maturase K n=1 Tax=Vespula squamosa TaxID=30214 RepID=A0ABD2A727_VESSQ